MTQVRMAPAERKEQLVKAAYTVAARDGLKAVTRLAVATEAGCTDGLTHRYFTGRSSLRDAALAEAVKAKDVATLAWAKHTEGFTLPEMPRSLAREVNKAVPV